MSFAPKTDYIGLTNLIDTIQVRSNGENASNTVVQIPGQDGSILGDEQTEVVRNPTCEYAIVGTVALNELKLGKVYSEEGDYVLQSISISTSAGGEPTFNATGVQIEENAQQTVCTYTIPSGMSISQRRHASTFGAVTFTESASLALQNGDLEIMGACSPTTINGKPVASDITAGTMNVSLTFWTNSDTTQPTVAVASGWHITTPWTCTGADSSMFTWTVTLTKYLTKDE